MTRPTQDTAAEPEPTREVTDETLTDEEILQYGRACRDGTATDAIARELCIRALGLGGPSQPREWKRIARARISAAINARRRV